MYLHLASQAKHSNVISIWRAENIVMNPQAEMGWDECDKINTISIQAS